MTPFEAIEQRMSIRSFSERRVERDIIERIVRAGWHAPCACNLQLMRYVVVDDPKLQAQLAKVASKKVLRAPVNIFFFIDPRFTTKRYANIMGLGAAMQNMCLAAHAKGVASCPMAGFEGDEEIKNILGVPGTYEAILILGVGYPDETSAGKTRQRLPLSRSVDYNRFDTQKPYLNESIHLSQWNLEQLCDYRERIAPVYRYQDRFALQSYNKEIYSHIFNQLTDDISNTESVLDLITYDGYFLNVMRRHNFSKRYAIADYTKYTLSSLQELYSDVETCVISNEHTLDSIPDTSVSFVTCVHKVEFMLDLEVLFSEVYRVLERGGLLFISLPCRSWSQRFRERVRGKWEQWRGAPVNVYEGNRFYKIGPHNEISLKQLCKIVTSLDFETIKVDLKSHEYNLEEVHSYYSLLLKK